jgi:hypothetical protein
VDAATPASTRRPSPSARGEMADGGRLWRPREMAEGGSLARSGALAAAWRPLAVEQRSLIEAAFGRVVVNPTRTALGEHVHELGALAPGRWPRASGVLTDGQYAWPKPCCVGRLTDRPVSAVLSASRVATTALAGRLSRAGRAAPHSGALVDAREGETIPRLEQRPPSTRSRTGNRKHWPVMCVLATKTLMLARR